MKIISISKESTGYKSVSTTVVFENSKGVKIDYVVNIDFKSGVGHIIRNGIDYAGIWLEDGSKRLMDYDMVFELSRYSIAAMRKSGIVVPRDFEPSR